MTTTEINWTKFYCPDEAEGWFTQPFVRGGRKYATDGRICICAPTDEPDTDPRSGVPASHYGNITGLMKLPDVPLVPWPTGDYIPMTQDCNECGGSGFTDRVRCDACKGDGFTTCDRCRHEHDCDECDGDGKVGGKRCHVCKGKKGPFEQDAYQKVDGRAISTKYTRRILSLDNPRLAPTGDLISRPVFFAFGEGGIGVVMPVNMQA